MKISNSKERIRELMDFYKINQTEFSRRTGVQKSALSNYLNGDRSPRQDQISKIADAFNVSASWLMGYDVPMRQPAAPAADQILDTDSMNKLSQLDEYGVTAVVDTIDREYSRCISQYREKERRSSNSRLA